MQVRKEDSVTTAARRAQIVAAAIETIADLGYNQASFARIAERAGLSSTRLISYHFDGKDDLIGQTISTVYGEMSEFLAGRVGARTSAGDALDTYIRSLVEYFSNHRNEMSAATQIFLNFRPDSGPPEQETLDLSARSHVERLLTWGQESGEFRPFSTRVMAMAVQRALDGLLFLLAGDPGADLSEYADELAEIFKLATRAAR
jgi:AcrR family transcriptional regulator